MMSDRNENPRGRWVEHRVTAEQAGSTVQDVLLQHLHLSRRMLQRLTRSRGLLHNRRPAFLGRTVREGDIVSARIAAREEPSLPAVAMELSIAYEDPDLLVLDKPPHLLVHPVADHHTATLAHGVAHHLSMQGIQAKVRPVHRLDRDTSGLVLFARSAFAHQHLDRQLREGRLNREYLAVVLGEMHDETVTVEAPIGRHRSNPSLRAVDPAGDPARTHLVVVERLRHATLVRLRLETGRTHQIRVHLQHLGHPVLGDRQYGGARPGVRRQALHAAALGFEQPRTGEAVRVQSPLPPDLQRLVEERRSAE